MEAMLEADQEGLNVGGEKHVSFTDRELYLMVRRQAVEHEIGIEGW
jgi:hypothetical protein